MAITYPEQINLKESGKQYGIQESTIQSEIYKNPSLLGLGDLYPVYKEKTQTTGGRIDLVLEDGETRYEVEIQLGATDESHIIRTIEYWDNERWKTPQYDHCAVIVAEHLTGRFFNVISLFNKHIPLIAIQMSAFKTNEGNISIVFSKVLDRVVQEDGDETGTVYDREYEVGRYGEMMVTLAEDIHADIISDIDEDLGITNKKNYIGVTRNGLPINFFIVHLFKKYAEIRLYMEENDDCNNLMIAANGEYKRGFYFFRVNSFDDYKERAEDIKSIAKYSYKRKLKR